MKCTWSRQYAQPAHGSQGGCIIRANFLDEIKQAYERDPALENLLMDEYFAKKITESQTSWRTVVKQAIDAGERRYRKCSIAARRAQSPIANCSVFMNCWAVQNPNALPGRCPVVDKGQQIAFLNCF